MLHCLNCQLNNFILRHIITEILIFFQLFFHIIDCLLFFDPTGNSPITIKMSRRVKFENLRSSFIVNGTQNRLYSIWPHESLLSVNLASVTHSLGQNVDRNHMAIFQLVVGSFFSQVVYHAFCIR